MARIFSSPLRVMILASVTTLAPVTISSFSIPTMRFRSSGWMYVHWECSSFSNCSFVYPIRFKKSAPYQSTVPKSRASSRAKPPGTERTSASRSRSFLASLYSALYISCDSSIRARRPLHSMIRFLIIKVRSSVGL